MRAALGSLDDKSICAICYRWYIIEEQQNEARRNSRAAKSLRRFPLQEMNNIPRHHSVALRHWNQSRSTAQRLYHFTVCYRYSNAGELLSACFYQFANRSNQFGCHENKRCLQERKWTKKRLENENAINCSRPPLSRARIIMNSFFIKSFFIFHSSLLGFCKNV